MGIGDQHGLLGVITPRYRNWGGPNHDGFKRDSEGKVERDPLTGKPLIDKAPYDSLDECFMRHDFRYLDANSPIDLMVADQMLIRELEELDTSSLDEEGQRYHRCALAAFRTRMGIGLLELAKSVVINSYVNLFRRGKEKTASDYRDPLILDLDGDGIETMSVNNGVYFDHDANGFSEASGWTSLDDGMLVMDRDGDGVIDDGKELFGDQTMLDNGAKAENGFSALAESDDNNDGKIDVNDPSYAQLRVWQDLDGDGYSAKGELHTLEELGIRSISLTSTATNQTDPEGNTQTRIGSFERSDGTTGQIGNYSLQVDKSYTFAFEWSDVPDEIATLPNLQGSGSVNDLHQTMVRDMSGQLKILVESFNGANDPTTRDNLLDQILFKWSGSDMVSPESRGANMDARKLAVLERFIGEGFVGAAGPNPIADASVRLNDAYRVLREMTYAQLMAQSHLKTLYDKICYSWDESTQTVKADLSEVDTEIQTQISSVPDQGKELLTAFARTLRGLGAQEMVDYLSFRETFVHKALNSGG